MRIIQLVILLLLTFIGLAQVPQGIKYQAIARSNQGQVVTNQIVSLEIAILQGGPVGQVKYIETHKPTTNEFGLFTIVIGEGTASQGSFSTIDWSLGEYFLRTSMDINGGNNYAFMGTSQLLSVPYALYAERTSKSDNDFDQDSTNELQTLDLTGTTLSISNGNSVQLGGAVDLDGDPTNEIQQLSLNGTQLNLSNGGGTIALPADNDSDPTNELQQLSLNGSLLELSNNGGIIQLPPDDDSDSTNEIQTISSSANGTERTISLSQSNTTVVDVADNDNDPGNELQDLTMTKTGNEVTINISNGTGTTINVEDGDADSLNEIQTLYLTGDTIGITDGNKISLNSLVNNGLSPKASIFVSGPIVPGVFKSSGPYGWTFEYDGIIDSFNLKAGDRLIMYLQSSINQYNLIWSFTDSSGVTIPAFRICHATQTNTSSSAYSSGLTTVSWSGSIAGSDYCELRIPIINAGKYYLRVRSTVNYPSGTTNPSWAIQSYYYEIN